jgi:hypothetical protein
MKVCETSVQLLQDLKSAIDHLSANQYKQPIELLYNASVGQHCRHIIEFFQCLENQLATGKICYDLRKRQIELEENPKSALVAIDEIIEWIESVPVDCQLQLEVNNELENEEVKEKINSSLIRELLFNIEHAIHHMAIIKIGLRIQSPEIELPHHFGVAPSTIRYHRQQVVQA